MTLEDNRQYEIMLRLRTIEGIDVLDFKDKFGYDIYERNKDVINDYVNRGYLLTSANRIVPTFEGMMILDKIYLDLA